LGAGASVAQRAKIAASLIYNRDASALFERLISSERPDLVHLHNSVRQLSPSILAVASRHHVPVVMTLHDYALVCPQGQMFKGEREACRPPNCVRGNIVHAVSNRCIKRSVTASAVAAVEQLIHRSTGAYFNNVAALLAPSQFILDHMVAAGIPRRKLRLLPNGLSDDVDEAAIPAEGGHALYAGRLTREKGVDVLLDAARLTPHITYVIAGDGPLKAPLVAKAASNVRFVGHLHRDRLREVYRSSVAIAVPSVWYENAPLSVLDAMRASRPIVATDMGGHVEMLRRGGGILIPRNDARALAAAVSSLWDDRAYARAIGAAGRLIFEQRFTLQQHVDRLMEYYAEALL
jgi:glycosyltransferase involved in cell wall biosynthesis